MRTILPPKLSISGLNSPIHTWRTQTSIPGSNSFTDKYVGKIPQGTSYGLGTGGGHCRCAVKSGLIVGNADRIPRHQKIQLTLLVNVTSCGDEGLSPEKNPVNQSASQDGIVECSVHSGVLCSYQISGAAALPWHSGVNYWAASGQYNGSSICGLCFEFEGTQISGSNIPTTLQYGQSKQTSRDVACHTFHSI